MEGLTRLVVDSLARHGLDRPVDPRRLQWSRWFRCDSPHSLLVVPSKPGIFALAEEIMDLGTANPPNPVFDREGHDFSRAVMPARESSALAAGGIVDGNQRAESARRLLAVLQFSEDDDMAFTLDRMFTRINPMRTRLASGRCFLRFVVIQDRDQRRSICTALNQWLLASAEKATGIGADFSSSLELKIDHVSADSHAGRITNDVRPAPLSASAEAVTPPAQAAPSIAKANAVPQARLQPLDSGAASNLHCPHPLPSGF